MDKTCQNPAPYGYYIIWEGRGKYGEISEHTINWGPEHGNDLERKEGQRGYPEVLGNMKMYTVIEVDFNKKFA